VAEPPFDCSGLHAFCLIERLGLAVPGQLVGVHHMVLACRVLEPEEVTERSCWCTRCGDLGMARDKALRHLPHAPVGWGPTVLDVTVACRRCWPPASTDATTLVVCTTAFGDGTVSAASRPGNPAASANR
jgi:hypothetical protein